MSGPKAYFYPRVLLAVLLALIISEALSVVFGLRNDGLVLELEAELECAIAERLIEDVWFTDRTQVVTVGTDGSRISVSKWDLSCQRIGSFETNEFLRFSGWPEAAPAPRPRYALRSSVVNPRDKPKIWFPFVVSPKADKLAWVVGRSLYVRHLSRGDVARLDLRLGADVVSLAFSGEHSLSLFREDGVLEHWDLATRAQGRSGAQLARGWIFWNQGPLLGIASLNSGQMGLLRVSNPNHTEIWKNWTGMTTGTVMALAPSGLPVMGTRNGTIVTFAYENRLGLVAKRSAPLPVPQVVRSAVFFDNDRLLVGGEFPPIYVMNLTKSGESFKPVLDAPSASGGIRSLAANHEYMLMATDNDVRLVRLNNHLRVTPKGASHLVLFSVSMALISMSYIMINNIISRLSRSITKG